MRRRLLTALTAAVLVATTATACGSGPDATTAGGKDKINVGAIPIVDVAPLYLGKAKGFFDKQNIALTITPTSGGAAAVPGVMSGQFEFAFGNVTSLLVARDQGLDLKVVAPGNASTGKDGADFSAVMVKKDSPIKSAKDLAGKTVSVNNLKNIGDTTVRASVRKAGGDPAGVKFVEMPFPDAPAALDKGRVDAIWVVEPFVTVAKNQGAVPIASNFVDAAPNLTIAAYFTTGRTTKEKPDLVKRFTAAIQESLQYATDHPDEARQILSTYTKIAADVGAQIVLPAWPTEVNRPSVQTVADLALQDGLLKKQADLATLLP